MSYSNEVPNIDVAAQLFSNTAIEKFQSDQRLQNTTKEMYGTLGTTLNVPLFDKIEMGETGFAPTDLPVTQIGSDNVQVTQNAYTLKTVVGVAQKTLFNFDFIRALAQAHGMAMGRMVDKIKIDALFDDPDIDPATDYYNVPVDTGTSTGMLQEKLTNARSTLEYNGGMEFGPGIGSLWLPAINYIAYFQDQTVTNQFFSNQLPLVNGQLNVYLGVSHRKMSGPAAGNNYIPFTVEGDVSTFQIPLVHREAVQMAFNISPQTQITYVPQQLRWEIVTLIVAGAKVLQNRGIGIINATNPSSSVDLAVENLRRKQHSQSKKDLDDYEKELKATGGIRHKDQFEKLQILKSKVRSSARVKNFDREGNFKIGANTVMKKMAADVDPNNFSPLGGK